ncbi:uncharacterized protein LY89DRAFT_60614 [Mollisia scopiformis]|uniref:Chitin-binding type-1 domain-containing protein n=1 Tax=Mollisia scopiformis TaxID=149040 RepID=A0A194XC50_MOLSC|nr:uncharacterized protein LY89DRAFT_60614 [Mollisia scopiformis]KUJ17739.1 hypothetical protein LY89DRAFT_60614 [Mollisia scopiformis]
MPIPPSSTSPALLVSSVMNVMQISSTLDINIIPSASPTPSTPSGLTPTDDGVCGNGVTCLGWPDGQCCSEYGYCGSDAGFCGIGCQSEFGICGMPAPPSSSLPPAVPSSTIAAPAMSSSAAPNCPSSASLDAYNCGTYYTETGTYAGFVWDQLFIGSCLTEDPNNPGNDPESPAITNEIASGTTAAMLAGACGYLNACMNWAIPQAYDNVDFHLLQDTADTAHWECVAYYDNAGGNYFDVTNYNVLLAYGYDVE